MIATLMYFYQLSLIFRSFSVLFCSYSLIFCSYSLIFCSYLLLSLFWFPSRYSLTMLVLPRKWWLGVYLYAYFTHWEVPLRVSAWPLAP
jgi:hypothetical protein